MTLPVPWKEYWWQSARSQARPSFDGLARRVETTATFASLVTDVQTGSVLDEIVSQFKARPLVRGLWGMEPAFQRGTGITVLFAGPSGTGKTLAAEAMANALSLDLYQIDLSQMVSKYIGETQKNLARVFDAAERGGSILLFDEADALFSKRTDVSDSKDRHANMEVGYLLQRMEAYSGIAVLTSNLKDGLDDAFLRRLQYVVDFPFPSPQMRAELWETMLPKLVPTGDLPGPAVFARLTLTGAQIRNVIRRAVYRAASGTGQLETGDFLHAAHAEMEKSDRALSPADLRRLLEC
ncbi:MAG: ATP-binding protein [Kordiimonadaceae bacterium]|nr:ATP-binding protein [Kordiimonadaceae bacterium]